MLGAGSTGESGAIWLSNLRRNLNIPSISTYGITEEDFPEIIFKANKASSMKANPVELSDSELAGILEQS